LEKIALLRKIVGAKILRGGTPGLETIAAWLPETIKRGKMIENTQPATI